MEVKRVNCLNKRYNLIGETRHDIIKAATKILGKKKSRQNRL